MKYVLIARQGKGTENARKTLEVFMKAGPAAGTQALYVGMDGRTVINIVESDTPDLAAGLTYSPFFEQFDVVPVVDVDEAWLEAAQAAQVTWD
jgi:hypothetical protein